MAPMVAPCLRCGRFTMATSVSSTSLAGKKKRRTPPIMLWCDRKKRFNWIASLKGGIHVAYHRSPEPRERASGPSLDVRGEKARLQIGRASGRERVCENVKIRVWRGMIKK